MSNVKLAVGLDAGSAHVRCLICAFEDGMIRYLGHGVENSGGWVKGRISDPLAATDSIRRAVVEAEKRAQVTVEAAVVGLGGSAIEGSDRYGLYELGRKRELNPGDISYAVELAFQQPMHDRQLVHVVPQDFTVDGRAGYRNPRGVLCSRLEAFVHVVTAASYDHQSLLNATHQASVAVEDTVFEGIAASYAAVLPEERNRGVAVVDVGAQSTDLVVFDGDALVRAHSLLVSADHFTKDAAFGLTVSYEDAECLKREYGCAVLGLTSENSLIEVPSAEGRAPREAPRRLLNEILEARAEQLFLHVRNELARIEPPPQLLEGIVLTGGGALLPGMCDMAEKVVNCPARNGLPIGIADWPEEINEPSWCVAAGLAMYSAKLKTRKEWKRRPPGFLGMFFKG